MNRAQFHSLSPIRVDAPPRPERGSGYGYFREISPASVRSPMGPPLTPPLPAGRVSLLEKVEGVAKLQDRLEELLTMQREGGAGQPAGRDINTAILAVEENLVKAARECEEAVSPRSPPHRAPILSPYLVEIPPPVPPSRPVPVPVPVSVVPVKTTLAAAVATVVPSRPLVVTPLSLPSGIEAHLLRSKKDTRMSFLVVRQELHGVGVPVLEGRHVEGALQVADNERAAGVVIVLPSDCRVADGAAATLSNTNCEIVFQNSAFPFTLGKAVDSVATTATLANMKK